MQETLFDPDEAERLGIAYSDSYARDREWEHEDLSDPTEDIDLFFGHIPGRRMLDVGCGWGRQVYHFLDHGLEYIGIDHSKLMIEAAQEANPGVRFEVMSCHALEFPRDTFDGLWCCCVLSGEPKHNMPAVLRELRRVLTPGGVMMIVMPDVHGTYEELARDNDGNPLLYYSSYELEELSNLLLDSGFADIERNYRISEGAMSVLVRKQK